jgi:hypothetical protein
MVIAGAVLWQGSLAIPGIPEFICQFVRNKSTMTTFSLRS